MRRYPAFLLLTALVCCTTAHAQLIVRTFTPTGIDTGVTAKFTFTVDPTANTLKIDIDNSVLGSGGVKGTIISFGFNTPFTDSQLGTNGSNVSFTQTFTHLNSGDTTPSKWNKLESYSLSGYTQDMGVGIGSAPDKASSSTGTNNGIAYGEKATFLFTFPDFTSTNASKFFDSAHDLTVYWKDVNDCDTTCDIGWANDLPPTPEPSTYGIAGSVLLLGLAGVRRKMRRRAAATTVA